MAKVTADEITAMVKELNLTVVEPPLFRAIEGLCKEAISYGDNHSAVRRAIVHIYSEMRRLAHKLHGYDTPDVIMLGNMIKRTKDGADNLTENRPAPKLDPMCDPTVVKRLNSMQIQAAGTIRSIHHAMQTFLTFKGSHYDSGGGARAPKARAADPLDVISEELYEEYKRYYTPWANESAKRTLRSHGGMVFTHRRLVLDIVTQDFHPKDLDKALGLKNNSIMKVLMRELNLFHDPLYYVVEDAEKASEEVAA